ncbi:MAG: hypothetical protein EWM72_02835 [Nitrospira sp.]|nr:MAG: hypothetical protein EWM72_02835 [Nitrospira sp.]
MSEQLVVTLVAVSVGFIAAIFLCIGSALTSAKNIKYLCGTYYGFNVSVARSLAAQRAQYGVGALLLVVSFGLEQVRKGGQATYPEFWVRKGGQATYPEF